jgi:hypothetical protein
MFKSKSTEALELLDQFRWIFQEVTNRNAEVVDGLQKRVDILDISMKETHKVLGETLNLIEALTHDISLIKEKLNED